MRPSLCYFLFISVHLHRYFYDLVLGYEFPYVGCFKFLCACGPQFMTCLVETKKVFRSRGILRKMRKSLRAGFSFVVLLYIYSLRKGGILSPKNRLVKDQA